MDTQSRATCWSITINMKNVKQETADAWVHEARSKGWKVTGQLEEAPSTGTLHYQLMVETPQTRFSAIKKAFPTAHIEVCRNKRALSQYVTKTDTRVGNLVGDNDKYPSVAGFWKLVYKLHESNDTTGWDESKEEVCLYSEEQQLKLEKDPLAFLDATAGTLIRNGYVIDHIITNPAVRSFWKKFYADVLYRTRETDRQTDAVVVPTIDIDDDALSDDEETREGSDADSPRTEAVTSDEGGSDEDSQTTDCSSDGE